MPRKKKATRKHRGPHIYWRQQRDGTLRAYADFRGIPGGKREALIVPGEQRATTDDTTAQKLFAERLARLRSLPPGEIARAKLGRKITLAAAVRDFLDYKRGLAEANAERAATFRWVGELESMLRRAVEYFGVDRQLRSIRRRDVVEWLAHLATLEHPKGQGYSSQSRRHHMAALGQLYGYGNDEDWGLDGYSPVSRLRKNERPAVPRSSTIFLEVPDAARLLEAARVYPRLKSEPRMVLAYPILATFLLSGGRADEVLGLDVADIDFRAKLVRFRPNDHRRGKKGKTSHAERSVPLWPQLEEILREYIEGDRLDFLIRRPGLTLLFPSPVTLGRITDIRDLVDKPAARAGLPVGVIRQRELRVTWATARLQTLDNGEPVAPWTVAKEAGHGSLQMVAEVYGRIGTVRHRSPVLEYRIGTTLCHSEDERAEQPGREVGKLLSLNGLQFDGA